MLRQYLNGDRFAASTRGSMSVLGGMMLVLMAIFGGMALDMGRWSHSKQVTLAGLDSAVLAGARWLTQYPDDTQGAIEAANQHYQENVRTRFDLETDTVDFIVTNNNKAVEATGNATLKTTLMQVAGISYLPLLDEAVAGLPRATIGSGGSNIEVSVMLDVTGSMCDDGVGPCSSSVKLDALKEATKKLVDMVVSADQSEVSSKVALVPFSTRVRIAPNGNGSAMMKKLTNLDATWSGWESDCVQSTGASGSEDDGDWTCSQTVVTWMSNFLVRPCVTDRYYDDGEYFDATDDAPGPGKWLNGHGGDRSSIFEDSSDFHPISDPVGTQTDPVDQWNFGSTGYCHDVDGNNEVMPLTSDKDALVTRIDGLEAYGATAGPLGTAWSWYMLSPKWGSVVWTGEAIPSSYDDLTQTTNGHPNGRKIAVLMTDGVYNTARSEKGEDPSVLSAAAKQMCSNMKAQGIEIFTVGLALNELSPTDKTIAEDTLQSCGTDIEHFYNTLSTDELVGAFQDIGNSLSQVTLTR